MEGIEIRTFGRHQIPEHDVVMGCLKVPQTNLQEVLTMSGHRQAFFMCQDQNFKRDRVDWIFNESSGTMTCLAQARTQAKARNCGIALRKGKHSNLGLIGSHSSDQPEHLLRRRWAVRNVPGWTPAQFEGVFAKKGWRVLNQIQPASKKGGLWTFSGAPPENSSDSNFVINIGDDVQLIVSPWSPRPRKLQSVPISSSRSWVSIAKGKGSGTKDSQTIAPTQIDENSDTEMLDSTKEGGDDVNMNSKPGKRPAEASVGSPPKVKLKTPPEPAKSVSGPSRKKLWDLKGSGDCGFRAAAASNAMRQKGEKKTTWEEVENNIEAVALSLRTKAVRWLRTTTEWKESWYPDPEANSSTEGGTPATTCDEYVRSCEKPAKWVDWWLTGAIADILQVDVIVIKYIRGKWVFLHRFQPDKPPVSNTPILLYLKDGHFTTLDPDETPDPQWLDSNVTSSAVGKSFFGGGSSRKSMWLKPAPSSTSKSGGAKSARSCSSLGSSWLKPQKKSTRSGASWIKPVEKKSSQAKSDKVEARSIDVSEWINPASSCGDLGKQHDIKRKHPNTEMSDNQQDQCVWTCPVCQKRINAKTKSSMIGSKWFHMKSHHPDFNRKLLFTRTKAEIVVATECLPKNERGWNCPLCQAGLPPLSKADKTRAIALHCNQYRPQFKGRSLSNINRGVISQGKRTQGHQVVKLPTPSHLKGAVWKKAQSVVYCKHCLGWLQCEAKATRELTCEQRREKLETEPHQKVHKRAWWVRLKEQNMKHANEFLKASGWSLEELDRFLGVAQPTARTMAWQKSRLQTHTKAGVKKDRSKKLWLSSPRCTSAPWLQNKKKSQSPTHCPRHPRVPSGWS